MEIQPKEQTIYSAQLDCTNEMRLYVGYMFTKERETPKLLCKDWRLNALLA